MDKIATPNKTKEIVTKHGFYFSKSLGQNFLIDKNIIDKIIKGARITKDSYVLEIGPGIGSLTQELAEAAKKVVAVEVDKKLIPILSETLKDYKNTEIVNSDILKLDLKSLIVDRLDINKTIVVGNLPYYITTPIIMKFLEEKIPVKSIIIMIQKEVAERMKAKEATKEYGALSIAVQYYCNVETILTVPPSVFIPQPKVESSVIRLDVLDKPRVEVTDEDVFFQLVKDAFGKRRKTLLNALSSGTLQLNKALIKEALEDCKIDEKRRGETLSIEEFALLANRISEEI
ncbi:16S rRNA (adenine(1518)-N(6)/adenine(1519)-N(6))-dimethyltransferase RsmA [Alkaliphilus pronyensis]|uniref:Ribosomal RNA small subunit methyltransferase A n=1 Tax=Alkaliphilus pronyensis TaxID=1482732 RepID=A0A6I0FNA6_9FIRM|nr:16S rRNA (adenine(1518)-N(6)/adenine(1519)-N(6))-dimethyltransferase RsmA [Alkaliphilus pronyensis]KAB3537804.1 16S rRNA (adenine(1518)-N(6)/adenine(1519)-N(6))-dimethyltransferase RsmA [Alkaliphilus pronyensis]